MAAERASATCVFAKTVRGPSALQAYQAIIGKQVRNHDNGLAHGVVAWTLCRRRVRVLQVGARASIALLCGTGSPRQLNRRGGLLLIDQRSTDAAEGAAVLSSYVVTRSEAAAHAYANVRSLASARVVIPRGRRRLRRHATAGGRHWELPKCSTWNTSAPGQKPGQLPRFAARPEPRGGCLVRAQGVWAWVRVQETAQPPQQLPGWPHTATALRDSTGCVDIVWETSTVPRTLT